MSFSFQIEAHDQRARAAVFSTPHGDIPLPAFSPVGTQATVKTLSPHELTDLGARLILANTYHLYLRPGVERIRRLGGLHRFMGWDKPILTDSGGFQVFSLSSLRHLDDDGVTFRSHIDGSEHRLTPEVVINAQEAIGADIIMCLDVCPPPDDRAKVEHALKLTHAWAERCRIAQHRDDQALFGIVQGGIYGDLRMQSVEAVTALDFPGYAIGGLSVGEKKESMLAVLDVLVPYLPKDRPRYLMGVGTPRDVVEAVWRGVDLFDCVLPTRIARNGGLLTRWRRLNIRNARFAISDNPVDKDCECYTCRHFSLAYLHHLFRTHEILGLRLATLHNLHVMLHLMRDLRSAILAGRLSEFYQSFVAGCRDNDEEHSALSDKMI